MGMKAQSEMGTGSWLSISVIVLLVAGLLIYAFIGCEQMNEPTELTTFEDPAIEELAADISNDLELSPSESREVRRAFTMHQAERRRPGYLWLVAGELQKQFNEDQMERVYALIERYEFYLTENGKFMFFEGWPALTARDEEGAFNCLPDLTEEQIERFKAIREAYAKELEELKEQYRSGELTEEEYRRAVQALMEALQQEFVDLLTDEQKERWRKCLAMVDDIVESNTSRAFQVMVRVLQLEREQLHELVSMQLRLRNGYHTLIRQFRAGEIDREEFVEGLWDIRTMRDAKLREILDLRQYEIVKIHQALVIRKALNQFRNIRHGLRG